MKDRNPKRKVPRRLLSGIKTTTKKRKINPLRIDPTRTATLRRQFIASLKRQFARLKVVILNKIVKEDALDLTANIEYTRFTYNKEWEFHTSPEKIAAFQEWIKQQLGDTVIGKSQEELWKSYIRSGYMKGVARSFDDIRGNTTKALADSQDKMDFYSGGREEFLRSSFSQPIAIEKVQLLAGRSFDDLENITDDMSTRMSRVLVDGLVQGNSPIEVGRGLRDAVDIGLTRATTIARTEIIRAHAEGQLDSLERMGIKEVGVMVEWSTAGDDRVCEECESMEGKIMDIGDAHGLIPVHPNCRCSFIPYIPGNEDNEEEDSKEGDSDGTE